MKLIPVIDLMNACVVTAKHGNRQAYTPSNTPLCSSSQPRDVLSALLNLHPFNTLYFADLDAIRGRGSNLALLQALCHDYPDITFWVDNGLIELDRLGEFARPVIGTESLTHCEKLPHLMTSHPTSILSLDYLDDRFIGPIHLDQQTEQWPEDVIVMTLSRVGSTNGPDLARLQQLAKQQPHTRLYAAGGVRNRHDLEQLRSIGTAGVLLSTALHQGEIDRHTITHFLNT